ncbi:MAG: hypothetical protein P1P84_01830 [Deferrisomatales bacterium]|nr:hypothetical protein [Deferrisomatales bacterium]
MKRIAIAAACLLFALPSVPSFAMDSNVSGFFRARFIMADLQKGKDNNPDTLVDQRARVKWDLNVDEYIKFVYYGEVDVQYGDAAYAGGYPKGASGPGTRNQGGGASADAVNLETKNLYIQAKLPDTPLTATIGIQGYVDHNDLAFLLGDMAGVRIGMDFGALHGNVAWFKMAEGDDGANHAIGQSNSEDDATLWATQWVYDGPDKKWTANADAYYANMNGATSSGPNQVAFNTEGTGEDLYYLTVGGKMKLAAGGIGGWLLYNTGTADSAGVDGGDVDTSAFAASVNGSYAFGGFKTNAYGIFFSSDDDATDNDRSAVRIPWATHPTPVGMAVPFPATGLMIMISDGLGTTYHTGYGFAMADGAYNEYGLAALTASATYTVPSMPNLWIKGAAGFFQALEDDRKADGTKREGKNLGSEIAGRVGYKFGKLELSLNAAYAMLGDFYDNSATDKNGDPADPDDPYEVYVAANVNF